MSRKAKKHPSVKGSHGLVIEVPNGPIQHYENGRSSHYLWFGKAEKHISTIDDRRELKKLRSLINKILGDS